MCIRDRHSETSANLTTVIILISLLISFSSREMQKGFHPGTVSYTHLRAHETVLDLVCRLLLEKKTHKIVHITITYTMTELYIHSCHKTRTNQANMLNTTT